MPIIVEPTTSPATTLDLAAVYLNLADDPTDFQAFDSPTGLVVTTGKDGGVRTLANGRTRIVTRAGAPRTFAVTLQYIDRTRLDWLVDHVGVLLCARDHLGRKMYGAYFDAPVQELGYVTFQGDISLTLTEVTHTEAV